jgi:hypothetical protein
MPVVPAKAGIHAEYANAVYLKRLQCVINTDFESAAWVPACAGATARLW